jgi:predicted Zn-dependent protease
MLPLKLNGAREINLNTTENTSVRQNPKEFFSIMHKVSQRWFSTLHYFHSDKRAIRRRKWMLTAGVTGILGYSFYLSKLEKAPITNRTRFMLISPEIEVRIGDMAYQSMLKVFQNNFVPDRDVLTQKVKRTVKRIVNVSGLEHLDWKLHIVNSPIKNAFVLPGGKIFLFTGMMSIAQTEDELATVLAHEVPFVY